MILEHRGKAPVVDPSAYVAPTAVLCGDVRVELREVQRPLDFPGTVYGVERGTDATTLMRKQSEWFGAHRDDRVL